jgi:hypothetical protein
VNAVGGFEGKVVFEIEGNGCFPAGIVGGEVESPGLVGGGGEW